MIPDWQTDRVYFSALLPTRHPDLWSRLTTVLKTAGVGYRLLEGTRDVWVRDFMPVQTGTGEFVLFRYRPDYLAGRPDLTTPDAVRGAVPLGTIRACGLNLDGGNVVADDSTAVLMDKVYRENPNRPRSALRAELARLLRAEVVVLPREPGDVIGHADGVVRFVADGLAVVNDYRASAPGYGARLEAALRRLGLELERLPYLAVDEAQEGIPSAVGNYVNFLRIGRLVLVPAYGAPQDDPACRTLERLLPGASVVPVRCEGLAGDGGVLNCVAWCVRIEGARQTGDG